MNEVLCGDCGALIKTLANNLVDLTLTSPPYADLRNYHSEFDFSLLSSELYRVTKKGGVVVWVVSDKTANGTESGESFRQALRFMEVGFKLHDTMIYAKEEYVPLNHRRYEQQFEYMFVFSKGLPKTFNPIMIPCKTFGRKSRMTTRRLRAHDGLDRSNLYGDPVKKQKTKPNIWFYSVGDKKSTKDKIAYKHPAIFPEKLAEDHVFSWTNEGDLVLDPMCGSGTTLKMAKLANRNWLGFEIDEGYCEIARERVGKA